jgi:hypothetical protein
MDYFFEVAGVNMVFVISILSNARYARPAVHEPAVHEHVVHEHLGYGNTP